MPSARLRKEEREGRPSGWCQEGRLRPALPGWDRAQDSGWPHSGAGVGAGQGALPSVRPPSLGGPGWAAAPGGKSVRTEGIPEGRAGLRHPSVFHDEPSNSFPKTHDSSLQVSKAAQTPASLGEQAGVVGADEAPGRPVPPARQSGGGRVGAFPGAARRGSLAPIRASS